MQIRNIERADIPALLELSKHMAQSSPEYNKVPFHDHVLQPYFIASIETPDLFFCRIVEHDGEIAGAMLACKVNFFISETPMATEFALFVYEKFRGTRAALLLEGAYTDWAKEQGCFKAQVGVSAEINDEAAVSFYKKRGYAVKGFILSKELN